MDKGTFVFLSKDYFSDFPDDKLMKNKEIVDGKVHDRPCFFAFTLPKNVDIFWVVPFSSQTDKYHRIYENKIRKYHKCDTIVFGEVLGHQKAFLIQNICPVTQKYIHQVYIDNRAKIPVRIEQPLANMIEKKAKSVLEKQRKGIPLIFPDVLAIELKLIDQIQKDKISLVNNFKAERTPFNDWLIDLQNKEKSSKQQKSHDSER